MKTQSFHHAWIFTALASLFALGLNGFQIGDRGRVLSGNGVARVLH